MTSSPMPPRRSKPRRFDEADEQEAEHEAVTSSDDETGWLKELSERGATLAPKARDSIEKLFAEEDSD